MFLRRHQRRTNGTSYDYWTLVEPVRTSRGPRQRTVATLGKLPGLRERARETEGCYLLRTNLEGKSAHELWKTYIGLTQIEDSLQASNTDPKGERSCYVV